MIYEVDLRSWFTKLIYEVNLRSFTKVVILFQRDKKLIQRDKKLNKITFYEKNSIQNGHGVRRHDARHPAAGAEGGGED